MDSATLAQVMGNIIPAASYAAYAPDFNAALIEANCTSANRVAMFCAQVGHESLGLRYMQEIASGSAYEGRADLGNTQRGDGVRFKGRGPIQLTGRNNYGAFSQWCKGKGFVPTATYFVDNPNLVATSKWGFLAASWYWTVARAKLNIYADSGDVVAATRAINGGTNGLADRIARWNRCRAMGSRLLPTGGAAIAAATLPEPVVPQQEEDMPERELKPSPGMDVSVTLPVPKTAGEAVVAAGWVKISVAKLAFFGPTKAAGLNQLAAPVTGSGDRFPIDPGRSWQTPVPDGTVTAELTYSMDKDTAHDVSGTFGFR